jgi:hypothetical protein
LKEERKKGKKKKRRREKTIFALNLCLRSLASRSGVMQCNLHGKDFVAGSHGKQLSFHFSRYFVAGSHGKQLSFHLKSFHGPEVQSLHCSVHARINKFIH